MLTYTGLARYYMWAVTEKALCMLPGGKSLYATVGLIANQRTKGSNRGNFPSAIRVANKAIELTPRGGQVVDVGTGWFHCVPFLLYLAGEYTIHLFDVQDKARLAYIHNYVRALLRHLDTTAPMLNIDPRAARAKLEPLLRLESRSEIYQMCNFVPHITRATHQPFLTPASVDFMTSTCVLNHIPPQVLARELRALAVMLKPEGYMYHSIGHADHWAFHSPAVNMFNYYRYSDTYYRRFFETDLEYHNRFVKPEWCALFQASGLSVVSWESQVTEQSRRAIAGLDHIDPRFASVPRAELAAVKSFVLLQRASSAVSGTQPAATAASEQR
jgi:Methyltransferase domain